MRTVKYISGSGREFILNHEYSVGIVQLNPNEVTWTYDGIEQQYGTRVTRFRKAPLQLKIDLAFRGGGERIKLNLEAFTDEIEKDILNGTEGRLYVGDEYISGYLLNRTTAKDRKYFGYVLNGVFFAPYPFWITSAKRSFYPISREPSEGDFLDYPYDYNYDYSYDASGSAVWNRDHYAESNFRMTIYGPVNNPTVAINGHPYTLYRTIGSGEYATIDSRSGIPGNQRVLLHLAAGVDVNAYDFRGKEYSVFKKIPAGNLALVWDGTFGFDLEIFSERSEPKWLF